MLQVTTEEQRHRVEEILDSVELWEFDENVGIFIDGAISFDKIVELADYIRSIQPKRNERFVKPTIEEIQEYIIEKGYSFDAEAFYAFYESNGWKVGKNPMKNWRAACTTWAKNRNNNQNNTNNYGRETITDKIRRTVKNAAEFKQHIDANIGQQVELGFRDSNEAW